MGRIRRDACRCLRAHEVTCDAAGRQKLSELSLPSADPKYSARASWTPHQQTESAPHKYTANVSLAIIHHHLFVHETPLQILADSRSVSFIVWIICKDGEVFVQCPTTPILPLVSVIGNSNKPNFKKNGQCLFWQTKTWPLWVYRLLRMPGSYPGDCIGCRVWQSKPYHAGWAVVGLGRMFSHAFVQKNMFYVFSVTSKQIKRIILMFFLLLHVI